MNLKSIFIILTCFFIYPNIITTPVIRLSMKMMPDEEMLLKKLRKPGKIAYYNFQGIIDHAPYNGIFSTYAGYLQSSDYNGQTLFPLKHYESFVYLLITDKITPISMFSNTIHHWETVPGNSALLYKIERKQDGKLFFWHTTNVPIPANNVIPKETITILAKPKYISVQTTVKAANDGPNLIIPDIYIKKGINIIKNALYILHLRHLFAQVKVNQNIKSNRYEITVY